MTITKYVGIIIISAIRYINNYYRLSKPLDTSLRSERSIAMGKYIINKTKTGYTFGLKAANGEVIATGGEVYSSLDSVKNGVKSVETNAPEAAVEDHTIEGYQTEKNPKFEIYSDKSGEFRFRLKAKNGQVIAVSEGYTSKANCKNGIESVKKNSVNSPVILPEEK